jgi:HAE1 family hydrophobic/amphiphilic exporter-1
VKIRELDIEAARGGFDPLVRATQNFQRVVSPATNFFSGALPNATIRETALTNSLGIEKPLERFGTVLSAEFSTSRRTTNNPFETFGRSNQSDLRFSFTQPLVRGRETDERRRNLLAARKNLELSDKDFRERTIAVIAAVETAYWDLSFALRNLKTQEDNLRETKAQLETVKRRVAAGELAPAETIPLERQIGQLEGFVYDQLDDVANRENLLKSLIVRDENAELWNKFVLPVEDFESDVPSISLEDALAAGRLNRPELSRNTTATEINALDRDLRRDRLKPQVDLTASYNLIGFAGSPNANLANPFDPTGTIALPPPTLTGSYLDSVGRIARNRFNSLEVGVTISFPVGRRSDRAELGKALVEGEKLEIERRQIGQTIQSEIRTAWATVQNARLRINAARTAFEAAKLEYASEKRKFEEGYKGTNTFNLLERQIRMITSENDLQKALVALRKSQTALQRATGQIVD